MTNAQKYFENVVNVEHTVLGTKLKPLCILHYLWLEHIESPLLYTSKPVTITDLEVAVIICSSSSAEEILRRLAVPPKLSLERLERYLWHSRNRKADLKQQLQAFLAYQDDYCSLPAFMSKDGDSITDEKLPWLLLYAASLIKATGWDEQTVMTLPLGKVVWLNAALGYLNTGETSIVSDKMALIMKVMSEEALTNAA